MNEHPATKRTALLGAPGKVRTALTPDALLRRLLAEADRQKLTPQELADRTDMPYSAAWKLLKGEARRPTLDSVMALASALGMFVDLFDGYGRPAAP